ncbi:hypothetical protein N5079_18380 [Planotetraspora sp. A-T 1434]|uniref:hypothetical protein n=1 Tax=Planotetraspora sp. A-T 1434 TaxID=2979219 RepID=UPI0021C00C32|nr:hypothetical protein [Planotetraspora sp. A-T 1434]MCT9932172.1 hypothetical protein [Planotetraspora sp. A-T 1434]
MINQEIAPEDTYSPPVPQVAPPTEEEEDRGSVLALIERIGSVVVPIGVALYAVLYIGVEQIYGTFGISPQQAGIDQSVLLGRLMGTLVLLIMAIIPAVGLVVGICWLINKITFGALGRLVQAVRRRPWIAASIAALWCGATYWGFFNLGVDLNAAVMVVIAVGLGVVTFLVPFRLLRRKPVGRAGLKVLVAALTGLGLGFLLILQLADGAAEVQKTGQSSDLLSYVGFQDQWAILRNADDDKPLYDSRWMMLLGESDGTYIFYDCDKHETFRRPMDHTNLWDIQLAPEREKGFACGSLAGDKSAK